MTRKMNQGMWLRQTEGESKAGTRWIIQMLCAMAASTMLILSGAELTGLSAIYPPFAMALVSGCVCAAYGIAVRSQRQPWFYVGALVIALILVLLFGRQLLNGICLSWNRMGDTWTAATGWVLPAVETRNGAQEISLLVFSAFFGIVCAVVCCALAACRFPALGLLLPALLFAGMIVFRAEASFPYVVPVLLTAVFLLMVSNGKEKGSAVTARLLLTAAVGIPVLAMVSLPAVQDWSARIGADVQERAHSYRYETQYTTLPEGDLSGFQENTEGKSPALVVNMDTPETLYLRGFTGAVFENDRWTGLDTAVLAENEDLLYWLNLTEFDPNAQYEQAVFDSGAAKNTVTVQNIGACSRYLYVPFNLCAGDTLQAEDLNTDGVAAEGERVYLFSTVSGSTEAITQALEDLQSADEEVLRYRKAESAYRDFVYDHYLQIPQEAEVLLRQHWDDAAARYGKVEELSPSQAQECALWFLAECFPEDGKPGTIRLPLEHAAGSSYQYATTAALTLRYFGIPARYAEGYIITEKMAAEAAGGSIEADSGCAGAWVEVYQDGLGWIPMELLPGFEGSVGNGGIGQDSDQKDPGKYAPEEGEALEEEPDSREEEPDADGGYRVSLPGKMLWDALLISSLLLLLLILALVIRRRLCLKRKQKRFHDQNKSDAVAWIFADAALLLKKMGVRRGNGSMQALTETIRQRFGDDYAESYEAMVTLNAMALFSSREIENTEPAMAFHAATVGVLKANTKCYQRMWMQWILCLY